MQGLVAVPQRHLSEGETQREGEEGEWFAGLQQASLEIYERDGVSRWLC